MKNLRGSAALAFLAGAAAVLFTATLLLAGQFPAARVLAAGAGPAAPATAAAGTADKCLKCHEMQQQVDTWHDSSHKDVDCLACHADPGVKGWWRQSFSELRRRIIHARGGVSESNISTTVPNSRCLGCHGDQMPYVMEDYVPPAIDAAGNAGRIETASLVKLPLQPQHDLHLSQVPGVTCTSCHNQVGHGTANQDARTEASHNTCNNCHRERQVNLAGASSLTCTACHVDAQTVTPANHDSAWRLGHGVAARRDSAACATCHLSRDLAKATTPAPLGDPNAPARAVEASWLQPVGTAPGGANQDACETCHQIPMPHPDSFLADHGKAYSADPTLCARCHLTEGQGFNLTVAGNPTSLPGTPACKDCHASKNPHPASEVVSNPSALAPVRVTNHPAALPTNPACQTCHAGRTNTCATCHKGKDWHPADWVTTHKEAVWKQGPNSCRTCHNTPDACTRCHRDNGPVVPQS